MSSYYNPRAYVPGGATHKVAQAIQLLGRRRPTSAVAARPSAIPPMAQRVPVPPKRPVDPILGHANAVTESMFSPLFAKLGAQRAAAEANARNAYGVHATALENALKASGAPIPAAFDTAIGQSAKVNEAVANRLSNQGTIASSGLATQLAQISADPQQAADLAKFYTNAGNAEFAHGAAGLSSLIGRRGEAAAYQGKLPGIGRLAANQGLESALSDYRGEFADRESDLQDAALNQVSGLYDTFRGEKTAKDKANQDAKMQLISLAQKDRATLRALQATATTAQEKMSYQQQEKALDRQLKWDIAHLQANTSRANDNPPKPPSVTGPANQKFITVNGVKTKNPNYTPPTSAKGGAGNTVAQQRLRRNKAVNDLNKLVFDPENPGDPYQWVIDAPTWNSVVPRINATISDAGIDPTSPAGVTLKKNLFKKLGIKTGIKGNPIGVIG